MSQEKTWSEVIKRLVRRELMYTRTMTVGRVERVLTHGWVEIAPQMQMVQYNPETNQESNKDLPKLLRVPIGMYKAGGMIMTLPIEVGDEGIIIVSDRDLDLWKSTGEKRPPKSSRFHDLSSCVFIPFPTSTPGAIQGYNTGAMVMGKEDGSDQITISKAGGVRLKSNTSIVCDTPNFTVNSTTMAFNGAATFNQAPTAPDYNLTAETYSVVSHIHTGDDGGDTSGPK